MNLQPRRAPQWLTDWAKGIVLKDAPDVGPLIFKAQGTSIWRMEMPNVSYAAPQAAFWWVSNEGCSFVTRELASSRRA